MNTYKDTIWYETNTPVIETDEYVAFYDKYPVTPGHMIFVPKTILYPKADTQLNACFRAAYSVGLEKKRIGKCTDFNIGFNSGPDAGQTINYPHVHLILRNLGDCDDPIGGVRGVIPGQANYKSDDYTVPEE